MPSSWPGFWYAVWRRVSRNRSATLWVERYFGEAGMCRNSPYAWVPIASRPGFWYVCSVAACVPQQIRNSMGGAVFWCGWRVPGRPLCVGSRCIAAMLLVCSVATCGPQPIHNSMGGAVFWCGWHVAGRPMCLGSHCIAAKLLVRSVATCVPQQIRNSRGGAVLRTRFAEIPLGTFSVISAALGGGTIAEMVAGMFACFNAGIAEMICKPFPQS